jgi:signal transduction histidine kinase
MPSQNLTALPNGYSNVLFQDSQNKVWVGSTKGVVSYDVDSMQPRQTLLPNEDVRCFAEAVDGSIWMGLQDGKLFQYEHGKVRAVQPTNGWQHSSIHALHFDATGTLWIGTWRSGLEYLKNGKWGTLTQRQGLPDDSIRDIQSDQAGNLWIGSSIGIFRISRQQLDQFMDGKIKSVNCLQLGTGDGLGAWEILSDSQPVSSRTPDGRLWYVTSVGLVVVDPHAIQWNALPPPVVIESLQADGRPIKSTASPTNPQIRKSIAPCPAGTRQLEISYTALSFSSPNQVRFRYRLQGLEKNWTEAANRRVAYFPHLPPGKYTFEVTACNNHGIWNETGAQLSFEVLPVFWQTGWFKLLLAAVFVSVLVLIYRAKAARLQALEQLRHRIARDLHDEVGANLGSISLLTEVMERKPQPGDLAQIRSTADQTVDTLRDLVWIINPSHEHLADLVQRLNQIASIMLANVVCRFEEPAHASNVKLPLEIRRNAPPLFKEILHNIQKHSHAQNVGIKVYCSDGNFVLQVQDDGVGFDVTAKRAGDGLKNFQNRAAEMRAQLTVRSQPGKGTTVELTAPITKSRDWRTLFK